MQKIITPPQCIGIMGGGQLGRMLAISAKQMGYKVAVLDPDSNCPASKFADYHIKTAFTDNKGLDELAKLSNVITTEFENVPFESLKHLNEITAVYPSFEAVKITQNRILEKTFFNTNGIATTKFVIINSTTDLNNLDTNTSSTHMHESNASIIDIFPGILKTATLGYDGKGQIRVNNFAELKQAYRDLNEVPCILEKMVNLKLEVSIIVARNSSSKIAYPVSENMHENGILDTTIAPARISDQLSQKITAIGLDIIEKMNYVGILAIEFFIDNANNILANEMAPRPHNSGHHTLEACITSQFEQQLRSVCNLKLGKTDIKTSAIMLNLLGNRWPDESNHPAWQNILAKYDNLKLHLYEKEAAKIGRKMGHLTVVGDLDKLLKQIDEIKALLPNR